MSEGTKRTSVYLNGKLVGFYPDGHALAESTRASSATWRGGSLSRGFHRIYLTLDATTWRININGPGRVESGLPMKTKTHFTFRVDIWDDAGDSIVEHVAGRIRRARERR